MIRILEQEVMDTAEEALEYEAMDHGAANLSFVERLLQLGATSGHALDIGTGPGHIPVLAAERAAGLSITAIDLAEEMLALARRRVAAAGLADRITVRKGDAKRLPFADEFFDAVFSNTILHHLEDPAPFLAEARRVLKPGGALLIRDLFRPASVAEARRLVDLHAAGGTERQRALFFDSLHAALTEEELAATAARAGLGDARIWRSSDRHLTLEIPRTRS
jgi:ubiquinone/menaquinone biosynthesis C-methylase UbiE